MPSKERCSWWIQEVSSHSEKRIGAVHRGKLLLVESRSFATLWITVQTHNQ